METDTDAVSKEGFRGHNTDPVTLTRWITENESGYREKTGKSRTSLAYIFQAIAVASKVIAHAVQTAGMEGLYALRGQTNVQGEDQKKLDVLANDVMINVLKNTGKVGLMISEENDEPIVIKGAKHARYAVVFDPLDGSSNIECNVSVGTIFGVYHTDEKDVIELEDVMKPGREMVAAGYVLYSSAVVMMLSVGDGVVSFTLDQTYGEFVMTEDKLRMPTPGKQIYSVNYGNSPMWEDPINDFVAWTQQQAKPYSLRYIGSMVSDVHRTLLYGGIFMYPADAKNKNGKLRMLYESFPMAFLIEQAGGVSTTGRERVLDIVPTSFHGRSPFIAGSVRDVEKVMELYKAFDGMAQKKPRLDTD